MKKFFVIIAASISLISCTKQLSTPQGAANQNVFFQNANVDVQNMKGTSTAAGIATINFSTAFENNISSIDVMRGTTTTTFCSAKTFQVSGNSNALKSYSFNDSNITESSMYYLLRFKDMAGNATFSNYVSVAVK